MPPLAYHFSVDDAFDCFLNATDRTASSSAEHGIGIFEFYDDLHRRFEADVDVYLFLEHQVAGCTRSLSDVKSTHVGQFQNRSWLRFAPHALNDATPPYSQLPAEAAAFYVTTSRHIERIAGPNRHSRWVRLHHFSECYELAECLRAHRVEALLTTDKPAGSYRLPNEQKKKLIETGIANYNGIHFVRSHIRIENLVGHALDDRQLDSALDSICKNSFCAVILTHEYELMRSEVREMTYRVFSWIQRRQLKSIWEANLKSRMLVESESGVWA
jgi:hypothetical protein